MRQIDELQGEVSQTKKHLSDASNNGLKNLGDLKEQFNNETNDLKTQNTALSEELTKTLDKHK